MTTETRPKSKPPPVEGLGRSDRHGQYLLRVGRRLLFVLQILTAFLSLLGIAYLLWSYNEQNSFVAEVFGDIASQQEKLVPLTPVDLADFSHRACLLDTGVSNVQSFLQPLNATLSSGGWCGNYVRVFIRFAEAQGYPAHKLHIQSAGRSHTLAEVYYGGKWRVIDPFFNQVYLLPNGEIASFENLSVNSSLVQAPSRRRLQEPRLTKVYESYAPIFPELYRDASDFYPGLDESALYHNSIVLLSYPLSLFYQGVRRPILPPWLDRPEMIGTYVLSLVFLVTASPIAIGKFRRARRKSRR